MSASLEERQLESSATYFTLEDPFKVESTERKVTTYDALWKVASVESTATGTT